MNFEKSQLDKAGIFNVSRISNLCNSLGVHKIYFEQRDSLKDEYTITVEFMELDIPNTTITVRADTDETIVYDILVKTISSAKRVHEASKESASLKYVDSSINHISDRINSLSSMIMTRDETIAAIESVRGDIHVNAEEVFMQYLAQRLSKCGYILAKNVDDKWILSSSSGNFTLNMYNVIDVLIKLKILEPIDEEEI